MSECDFDGLLLRPEIVFFFLAQWEENIHKMRAIDSNCDKDPFLLVNRVFLLQQSSWFRLISDDNTVL